MPEHYTRGTLECTVYCSVCGRDTQHRVDGVRRGPCLEHSAKVNALGESKSQETRRKKREKEAQNPRLF